MSLVPWEMAVAAGRQGVPERATIPKVLVVEEEVQDRREQQGDRLVEVDQLPDVRWARMLSGSLRSAWTTMVLSPASRARLWATIGSLST